MRRVAVRDERTWESSCEYGLFRSPAMAVSVDAVPPPATPRGLHPRQRASFLQGWSNTTLRGGTLRSSRGHYLAPPPVGMSRVGSFASRSVLSAGSARTRARARVRGDTRLKFFFFQTDRTGAATFSSTSIFSSAPQHPAVVCRTPSCVINSNNPAGFVGCFFTAIVTSSSVSNSWISLQCL